VINFRTDLALGILDSHEAPCLSLFQPTHRHPPQNRQDPIRYRNLVKTLEASLRQKYGKRETDALLDPFTALSADQELWSNTLDGLAVLGNKNIFRVYKLQRHVQELAVAADSFHIKPLLRLLQTRDSYHVLGITRKQIRLYEGNRDALDEIPTAGEIPRTMIDALGKEVTEPHLTVASYGGSGNTQSPMHHGHGGRKAEVDLDTERFFRKVDKGILKHHSQPSGLPLILATLPEHRAIFNRISHNPHLLEQGVDTHPDSLNTEELRKRAWQIMEPHFRSRLSTLAGRFNEARSQGRGVDALEDIAAAVVAGRVGTLLVEAEKLIPGNIDPVNGKIVFGSLDDPATDDILDDLVMLALNTGAEVLVVPGDTMPAETGAAALLRY